MFWIQIWVLKKFLDRSASFFGKETHDHVKTIRNVVWRPKMEFFIKMHLNKCMFSLCFLRFPHFESKIDFLIIVSDDSAWVCLEKLKKDVCSTKNLNISPKSKKNITNKKIKSMKNKVPCGPVGL